MKKLLITIQFLSIIIIVKAQPGIDNIWLSGVGTINSANKMDFMTGVPVTSSFNTNMNFTATIGLISDTIGNLLFYTNGCYIANSLDSVMFNGSGLNPGACTSSYCPSGNVILAGNIVLQDPGNSDRYFLFHETCDIFISGQGTNVPSKLYYSTVDMSQQGGLGAVIQKNIIIISDTLDMGFLSAIKHANGRDWWIVVHKFNSNLFYTFLLTPYGLQGPYMQAIGVSHLYDGTGQTAFSPDGTKLATSTWWDSSDVSTSAPYINVSLFDFDRCTGLFSNPDFINLNGAEQGGGGG